jgi:hypothetical protein
MIVDLRRGILNKIKMIKKMFPNAQKMVVIIKFSPFLYFLYIINPLEVLIKQTQEIFLLMSLQNK